MTDDSARIAKGGDIDPATVDLADRQARRARNRPATPPELRGWEDAAQRRMMRRPYPVNIMLEPAEIEGREHWTSPHDDPGLWTLQLAEALGTRSQAVLSTFVAHLEELVGATMWDAETERRRVNESEFSAMLSIINSQKPNDEMQAMLCAQMVAVHWLQMKVSARAIRYPYETKTVAAAGKLARTFVMQMDALQQAKGKRRTSRQTIKVTKEIHQHVHYHATQGGKGNERQSHEPDGRAEAADHRPALPSPDEGGNVVPLAMREGKASVSASRGKGRRTQGAG